MSLHLLTSPSRASLLILSICVVDGPLTMDPNPPRHGAVMLCPGALHRDGALPWHIEACLRCNTSKRATRRALRLNLSLSLPPSLPPSSLSLARAVSLIGPCVACDVRARARWSQGWRMDEYRCSRLQKRRLAQRHLCTRTRTHTWASCTGTRTRTCCCLSALSRASPPPRE